MLDDPASFTSSIRPPSLCHRLNLNPAIPIVATTAVGCRYSICNRETAERELVAPLKTPFRQHLLDLHLANFICDAQAGSRCKIRPSPQSLASERRRMAEEA